jgi:hypothetical protein
VEARLKEMRGSKINENRFGHRMKGEGTYWRSIQSLFAVSAARFGLSEVLRDCVKEGQLPAGTSTSLPVLGQANPGSQQMQFEF